MKFSAFLGALLLVSAGGFAQNSEGFVHCGGLFLIDIIEKKFSVWTCSAESELQLRHLRVDAAVRHLHYEGGVHFKGMPRYAWDLNLDRSVELGSVGISTDYKFVNLRADVSSMPYVGGTIGWQVPDSLVYASASIGRGQFDLGSLSWHLDEENPYIQDLQADMELRFLKRHFTLGSAWGNRKLQADFIGIRSRPDLEGRYGLVLSDTSDLWLGSLRYTHEGVNSGLKLWLAHAWGNVTLEGLHREEVGETIDEKRFFYLPVDFSASLAVLELYFMRRPVASRADKISLLFAYGRLDAEAPYIPWKKGRFYPTVAPNQVLDNSIIKFLSLNVYNRSFRIYGDASLPVWVGGSRYTWGFVGPGWKWHPSVGLHGFYLDDRLDLTRRGESKVLMGLDVREDQLNWKLKAVGAVLTLGLDVDSPGERFFLKTKVLQVLPFYYKEHHLDTMEPATSAVTVDPEGSAEPGTVSQTEQVSELVMYPTVTDTEDRHAYRVFRNGFAAELSLGIRF